MYLLLRSVKCIHCNNAPRTTKSVNRLENSIDLEACRFIWTNLFRKITCLKPWWL